MFHQSSRIFLVSGFFSPLIGIILLLIVLAAIRIHLAGTAKRKKEAAGLSAAQQETLENIDPQVISLLNQHSGSLTQLEIRNYLNLPNELVAEKLNQLEKEGEIERTWLADAFTFRIRGKV